MATSDFLAFISAHTLLFGIVIVVIWAIFWFIIKPRFTKKKSDEVMPPVIPTIVQSLQKQVDPSIQSHVTVEPQSTSQNSVEKDTTFKRMKRGFGVMREKVVNSNYAQNLQAEQKTGGSWKDNLPPEIFQAEQDDSADAFATDFSQFGDSSEDSFSTDLSGFSIYKKKGGKK